MLRKHAGSTPAKTAPGGPLCTRTTSSSYVCVGICSGFRTERGGLRNLAVLSEHPTERMPAQELCALLQWEKSRLLPPGPRMEKRGLVVREPNPADARSAMICLLPADAGPLRTQRPSTCTTSPAFHRPVHPRRTHTLAALDERVLRHLAEEPFPEQSTPDDPELPR